MGVAGETMARIQLDAIDQVNQVRVEDALTRAKEAALRLTFDPKLGFSNIKGEAALNRESGRSLVDEYSDGLQQELRGITDGLGNEAQRRAFLLRANEIATGFRGQVQAHANKQFVDYDLSVQAGRIRIAANAIALNPLDQQNVDQAVADIRSATYREGAIGGKSADEITATMTDRLSAVHTTAIKSLLDAQNTDAAAAYFKQYKGQMAGLAQAEAGRVLGEAGNAKLALQAAGEIWSSLGPKGDGQAVELDKLEEAARARFKDDPQKVKATISELRERAVAFNSSEGERAAANVNAVMLAYSKGAGLAALRGMPAFQSLPGKQRADIEQHVTDRQHLLSARSVEDQKRVEAQMAERSFGAYLVYSNPETLAKMSESQIGALLPVLGSQLTGHLMNQHRALGAKAEKIIEAKIDQEDFNHLADEMGLRPYEPGKSNPHKAALGELKYRVENLINQAQQNKGKQLTRQEKMDLVRGEMARSVQVSSWWGMSSDPVPVLRLTKDQVGRVVVPAAERAQIVEALRVMNQRRPGDPRFAPTEENLKRIYVEGQSRLGFGLANPARWSEIQSSKGALDNFEDILRMNYGTGGSRAQDE